MKFLLPLFIMLALVACQETEKTEIKTQEVAQAVPVKEAEKTQESPKASDKVKEIGGAVVEKVAKGVDKAVDVFEETKGMASGMLNNMSEAISTTKTAQELFAKCVACHGKNGQKSALNKSKIIQGWSVDKTTTALYGYKDGSYGGSMKGMMKAQIKGLSDDELKVLAEYIATL